MVVITSFASSFFKYFPAIMTIVRLLVNKDQYYSMKPSLFFIWI